MLPEPPYRTMRLTGPTTRVHPAESQKVLLIANYIRILPLTPCPYVMTEFNIFYSFTVETKAM